MNTNTTNQTNEEIKTDELKWYDIETKGGKFTLCRAKNENRAIEQLNIHLSAARFPEINAGNESIFLIEKGKKPKKLKITSDKKIRSAKIEP